MPTIGPITTAMVTPFDRDGGLDLDGARRLAAHLVGGGTDTVLVTGTTGESPTVTDTERWELVAAVRDAVGDRATVMVGTGTNATAATVAATGKAADAGADAVLVVTPYYSKPSQRGLLGHFTAAAAATDLPVVLYDIPGRTGREIALDTLVELAQVDNVAGVKDATGDVARAAEVVAATAAAPGGFELHCGADELNLPMLAVGAAGFVSVASHLAGNDLADMVAVFGSDPGKAREIHLRLMPLYRALFLEPNPAPLKGALAALDLPAGPVRPPLADATGDTVQTVLDALDRAGIRR